MITAAGQHGFSRDFAVRQQPVNEKENGDAGGDGKYLHGDKADQLHIPGAVAVQGALHDGDVPRGQTDG